MRIFEIIVLCISVIWLIGFMNIAITCFKDEEERFRDKIEHLAMTTLLFELPSLLTIIYLAIKFIGE